MCTMFLSEPVFTPPCLFVCVLCCPPRKASLINHAVFGLGPHKEKKANAKVTNAAERAGKNLPFFPPILSHTLHLWMQPFLRSQPPLGLSPDLSARQQMAARLEKAYVPVQRCQSEGIADI